MTNKKPLVIVGTGETGRLAYEYFTHDSDYQVVAFAVSRDYIQDEKFNDLPVLALEDLESVHTTSAVELFVAMASGQLNRVREKIYIDLKNRGYRLASYISSNAFVWHDVVVGDNCFILENNVLQSGVKIGNNTTLWSGNHIGHLSKVGCHCFITSHVVICGSCEIGSYSFIGVNATVADGVRVAEDNFVGMGAVIARPTDSDTLITGNPAEVAKISARRFCKVKT